MQHPDHPARPLHQGLCSQRGPTLHPRFWPAAARSGRSAPAPALRSAQAAAAALLLIPGFRVAVAGKASWADSGLANGLCMWELQVVHVSTSYASEIGRAHV